MTHFIYKRGRLGGLLATALAALAVVALPGLASARDDGGGDSAATIKSFDQATRALVLSLPDGQALSGTVTRRTKIRCEDESAHRSGRHEIRGREAEPGDDRGRGDSSGPGSAGAGGGHDDNGRGANCGVGDLVAGAAVDEIEVDFGSDSVRFEEIELDD
jgi:hypothetical protein